MHRLCLGHSTERFETYKNVIADHISLTLGAEKQMQLGFEGKHSSYFSVLIFDSLKINCETCKKV